MRLGRTSDCFCDADWHVILEESEPYCVKVIKKAYPRVLCLLEFVTEKSGQVACDMQDCADLYGSTLASQGQRGHHRVAVDRIDLIGCRTVSPHCRHPW
jgi:hypothetical protein